MNVFPTEELKDILIIEPKVFEDSRGLFFESFNEQKFAEKVANVKFVQDNHSVSSVHVLRGLHYQIKQPQGKLVRCIFGEALDVCVDLRKDSATFGKWTSVIISSWNKRQVWVPPGFAHGFIARSGFTEIAYKTTDYYFPEHERTLLWNDPDLKIDWKNTKQPILSEKDQLGKPLKDAETY